MWYSNLGKHLFLDISSTNIDTLVPSLYQCVKTHSKEVFWLFSQPLPQPFSTSSSAKRLPPNCEPLYSTNTSHRKQEKKLRISFSYSPPPPPKTHNRTLPFGSILKHDRNFDYWNQPPNMRMRVSYLDSHEAGLCCYLVIHTENRVLLPFVTYLLTLPRTAQ
jgi:hypothetical protein